MIKNFNVKEFILIAVFFVLLILQLFLSLVIVNIKNTILLNFPCRVQLYFAKLQIYAHNSIVSGIEIWVDNYAGAKISI